MNNDHITTIEPVHEPIQDNHLNSFRLSFRPFVAYLNARQSKSSSTEMRAFYSHLIDQFTPALAVENPAEDLSPDQLTDLFQLATVAVLPLTSSGEQIPFAFGLPTPLRMFYQSEAFSQLVRQYPDLLSQLPAKTRHSEQQRFIYRAILEKCYAVRIAHQAMPSFRFQQEINGLTRYYRMAVNLSFLDAHIDHPLPALHQSWIDFANGSSPVPSENPLPTHEFTFEGFSFFRLEDVTETETIQQMHDIFVHLQSDTEATIYRRFEKALRNLCGQPDLQISIVPLPQVNGSFVDHPTLRKRSIFLRHAGINPNGDSGMAMKQQTLKKIVQGPFPYLFPNLDGLPEPEQQVLRQKGIRSFLMYPIATANEVLGILEMGSPQPDTLDETILTKLEQILPLIQELLRYQLHQFQDNLEGLVKKQFTSLQPAVEWKFYEVAWESLRQGQKSPGAGALMRVEFPQVYPLYGAVDVRDSSVERHRAVRQDLTDQLMAVRELLRQIPASSDSDRLPRLVEQYQHWQARLDDGLRFDDEQDINQFLTEELHPYFRAMLPQWTGWTDAFQHYFNQTDPRTEQFNQALSAYERSLDWINATLNDYINEAGKELQAIYPHYIERYRTDGMEYTMYTGQSIAPHQPFGQDYLRRLSEWQLTSMVEMAQLTHRLLPRLQLPLRTTQLILIHTHPVDIAFRQDERRFDVEGSYSVRYEVLKKRIDKAYIAGTLERLTQPDTIALVYSHSSELTDYLDFIASLQQQGMLEPGVDYFDLEPLQGVTNLKALRVRIKYNELTEGV